MTSEETEYLARNNEQLCKRSKRLENLSDVSTHNYKPDSNGCTHNNMETFQREENNSYWDPAWRKKNLVDKGKEKDQLDTHCRLCGKSILVAMRS